MIARPRALGALAALLAFFLATGAALAAEPARHPPLAQALKGDARVLYDSARDLYKAGDYASAYAKFQHALELSRDPRLYWNMAACERKAKHNANVLRLIDTYLREGEGWLSEDDTREAARAAAAVRVFVASATLKTDPASGVDVFVDDARLATTPAERPIFIDAGLRRIRFAKAGFRPVERSEDIAAGAELTWSIELVAVVAAPVPPPPTPPPVANPPPRPPDERHADTPPPRSPTGPFVLGGAGLAVAATGGVLALTSARQFSSLRAECGSSCDRSRWEKYRTMQIVGDVMLAAGGAALIGGVVWWVSLPRRTGKEQSVRAFVAPLPGGLVSGLVY